MLTEIALCSISKIRVGEPLTTLTVNLSVVCTAQVGCERFRRDNLLGFILSIAAREELLTATSVEIR